MSEVQHITLVAEDSTSLKATFMRCGATTVELRADRSGRTHDFDPVVMRVQLSRKEIRGFGEMMVRLADTLDSQSEAPNA